MFRISKIFINSKRFWFLFFSREMTKENAGNAITESDLKRERKKLRVIEREKEREKNSKN